MFPSDFDNLHSDLVSCVSDKIHPSGSLDLPPPLRHISLSHMFPTFDLYSLSVTTSNTHQESDIWISSLFFDNGKVAENIISISV